MQNAEHDDDDGGGSSDGEHKARRAVTVSVRVMPSGVPRLLPRVCRRVASHNKKYLLNYLNFLKYIIIAGIYCCKGTIAVFEPS